MARGRQTKAVDTVGSKRTGTKRDRYNGDEAKAIAKRPRQMKESFRFLDLPGELRNRIYQYAFDISYRSFPASSFRKKPKRGESPLPANTPQPIPYLSLTQSCTQIRREFRPWWMGSHKIPLCALDNYLSAFFPSRLKETKAHFEASTNTAGELRIFLRQDDMRGRDLLRLVKHKLRFPDYTIVFQQLAAVSEVRARGLEQLVNNQHPTWNRWIRRNDVVSQIRIGLSSQHSAGDTITVVMKEKHALPWMKPTLNQIVPNDFPPSIGLDKVTHWQISFAVDYS